MSQAFYVTDTLRKMAPLAFCSSLDTILSTLLPVVLIVSVLQCPSLRSETHNILQAPAQTPELPCPHGHCTYNIPWASCLLHACICMSLTSWILKIHRPEEGPGFFLRDTVKTGSAPGPFYPLSLVLTLPLIPLGCCHGHSLCRWETNIFLDIQVEKNSCPKYMRVWVK